MGAFMETYSGNRITLPDVLSEQISLIDIAHALSYIPRFGGHTSKFYSVAQHCMLVVRILETDGPKIKILGLLHDAHEAYIGDITTPMKTVLERWSGAKLSIIKNNIDMEIYKALDVEGPNSDVKKIIKQADISALIVEAMYFGLYRKDWEYDVSSIQISHYMEMLIDGISMEEAMTKYIQTYWDLKRQLQLEQSLEESFK